MDDEVAVAATTRVAQVFDLHALKAFAPDKRVRKMLFKTEQLWSEIACYEPGQSTVMHAHPGEEEAIFVREYTANMNIDSHENALPAGAHVRVTKRRVRGFCTHGPQLSVLRVSTPAHVLAMR